MSERLYTILPNNMHEGEIGYTSDVGFYVRLQGKMSGSDSVVFNYASYSDISTVGEKQFGLAYFTFCVIYGAINIYWQYLISFKLYHIIEQISRDNIIYLGVTQVAICIWKM